MRTITQLCTVLTALLVGSLISLPFTSKAQCPDATITIEIFTDNYPEETTWELIDQSSGAIISGDDLSISGAPNTLYTWTACVSATGCYDFNIYDAFGDGICCAEGFGYYNVYFNGVLEATGGSFLTQETVSGIGGCSSSGCPDGTMVLQLFTDQYPSETSWQLVDTTTGAIVASDDLAIGGTSNTLYTWNVCVNNNGCYEFTVFDDFGDGFCCGFGNGYYNLYLNGNLIKTGGSFGFSESTNFGSCQSSGTCGTCQTGTPPLNDACTGATNLGLLTPPSACPTGLGSAQTFNGTTLCATAEFPYGYIIGCQTGGDMSAPAADVWYSFQITGTVLGVQLNSTMRGVSIGLWQDAGAGCTGLVARNCAETTLGGNLNTTFTALNPGIYYLQVSGLDTLDQCDFTLTLTNNEDCAACIQQNNLTASPAPVNGRYQAGTTVTFTYTILDYNQTSINWIHGIVPHFGAGWDLSTLTGLVPPQSCDADGYWAWYNRVITGTAFGISDGPGFFFESTLGCSLICDPNNPGDNYGDEGVSSTCPLTFQWTITTTASCPPGQNGDNLNIEIFNYGDSETGSWTSFACQNDPNYNFFATLFCCDSSDITVQNISCSGGNTGSITVQGNGIAPYDYELLNQSGTVIQSSLDDADSHTFIGLAAGTYTVRTLDENNCTDVQVVQLTAGAPLVVTGAVTNVSCNDGSDGAINISVSGGSGPYTYDWNGFSGEDRTGLIAGTYTVQVFDSNLCAGTGTFVVSQPAAIANTIVPVQICEGQSYFAGGDFQTESGTYFDSLQTPAGCDSTVETHLTVSSALLAQVDISICDGESYFAGGADQTESGIYYDSLQTSDGCDSIVETQLTVLPNAFTQLAVSICDGQSYFAGGADQTESGIYLDTYTSVNGCDSTVETTLTVLPGFTENQTAFICDGDSLFLGGAFQTESGIYFDSLTSSGGCDSIIITELTVGSVVIENATASICAGDSLFVGGAFQTQSGIYADSFQTASGCDSVLLTALTVLPTFSSTVVVSICDGESYFAGGADQTTSGTYTDTYSSSNGCDSVVTTELTVLPLSSSTVAVSICDGESYFAGGADQTTSGSYTDTYTAANGCDSVVTTELTVLPLSSSTVAVSICDGESYFAGGADQTTSGTYTDTYTAANGCDSVVTTELTVLPHSAFTQNVSICDGESYFAGGADQTTSGTYTDTYTAANGCDSVVTTELIVLPNSSSNVTVTICDGDSYFVGGADQTQKGTYFDTLVAANGCDSVVITELDVLPNSFTTQQVSICEGDSYFVGGADQTDAGTYYDTLVAANGCDSIVATDLLLIAPTQGFTSASICEGDSYFVGGADQTEAGFYTDTLVGSNGCDSILTTQLIVIPPSGGNTQVSICQGESYFVGGADQTQSGFYFDTLVGSNGCDSILTTELAVIEPTFGNAVVSICNGESYFVGGANQTQPGFYFDTLTAANGCDSILTTQLIVLPSTSFTQNISVCSGEGVFAGGGFQTESGTYTDNYTGANGCDSVVTTVLTVGEELDINFDVNEVSCCTGNGSGSTGTQPCAFDIAGLAHGTHVDSLFIPSGTTVVAIPNSGGRPDAVIYNTNGNWTEDSDLNTGVGNVIIINENPNNNDGDGTGPDDNGTGGTLRFLFNDIVTVVSFIAVDVDKPGAVAYAYDASNNLITSVAIPQGADGSVQTISVNAPGTKRFDLIYRDSGGFRLNLECAQNCSQDLSSYAHGQIVTGQEIAPGVTVTGISNTPSTSPNAVAIFNSNVSNSVDPDLEVGIGNLLILPQNLTDNNNDGILDVPNDGNNGGKMIFTFDRDRTVYSLKLVDNDRNNGTVKAYDANNNLLLNVGTPSLGQSTIQLVTLNVSGVRKLEISYWDSRGVTDLVLDCIVDEPCCDGNATANVTGGFPPYQFAWSTGSASAYSGDSLCVGLYSVTVTDALGCSTTESVSLITATVTAQTLTICEGDSLLLEGAFQTKAGFYYDTLGVNNGCFEILKSELIVLPGSSATVQVTICEGQSYFAGGADQTESGTYLDVLTAANGCDSVVTTELTVLPAFASQVDVQICEGQSYFAGGADQTESGTYVDIFTTASGCDSIVTTELTVLPASSSQVDVQICEGQSYFAGGADQTESGTYADVFTTASGCDSIVTTNLTVVPAAAQTVQVSICTGESYFAGGADQTQSGVYVDSFVSASGCDSIVITELTVTSPLLSGSTTHASCFGSSDGVVDLTISGGVAPFTFTWSNNTTKEDLVGVTAGTYSVAVVDANGCSATETFTVNEPLPLSLGAVPTPVTCFGGSDGSIDLFVQGGTDPYTYIWTTGETTEDISGLEAGFYTVEVTDANNCEATVIVEVLQPEPAVSNAQVTICEGESYFVGGADQTEAGTYFDTLVSPLGCDSVVITDLTVLPVVTSNAQATICEGQTYFAGGDFQTQSGIYFDTLAASNGCDSILITELTVLPLSVTNFQVSICEGESYFAGGDFQTESGTYTDSFVSANGCDSLVVTELSVLPAAVSNVQASICTGQSYFAGGDFQTQSGIYFDSLTSSAGCDSVLITELTVQTSLSTNVQVSICEGQSYFAGGADQTESGSYFDTLSATGGCDSVVMTELTVLPASTENITISICEGDSYFAGGDFQTESGIYFDTFATANGCDSILITELTVLPISTSVVDAQICDGQSYFAGGDFQTASGTYIDVFTSSNGCDSIVTTNLTVSANLTTGIEAVICAGESYFAGGGFQTIAGTYFDTLQSSAGCDSIIITDLVVLDASSTTNAVSICAGDSYFTGGADQTESGTYFDTLSNTLGCDSIVITELTVLSELLNIMDVTICNGESYFAGGDFQTASGTYFDTLSSSGGCDSIIQTNLTITSIDVSGVVSDVSCFGGSDGSIVLTITGGTAPFTFQWSNNTTDKDASGLSFGPFSVTVTDATGCTATQGFFVEQPAPLALGAVPTPVSCNGESDGALDLFVQGGNQSYTFDWSTGDTTEDISNLSAGFYTVIVTDSKGCQATVISQLLEPAPIILDGIVTDETVSGSNDGAIDLTVLGGTAPFTFIWSNGETTEDISDLSAGTYNVTAVDDNGCTATGSYAVNSLLPPRQPGVNQGIPGEFDLFAYPNPFEEQIVVEFNADEDAAGRMILRDVLGKRVYESRIAIFKGENKQQISFDADILASGIYILEIVRNDETVRGVRTLIKQ